MLVSVFISGSLFYLNNSWALPDCPLNQDAYKNNCFGSKVFPDGVKYIGEWKNNKQGGIGTQTWNSGKHKGDKYIGDFKDGIRTGVGTYIWADGGKYQGYWKDNNRHGQGIHKWADGDQYDGEWKNNKKDGIGIETWNSGKYKGDKYIGDMKDGKRNGLGIYTFANGKVQEGFFKDNNFMYSQKILNTEKNYAEISKPNISSAELDSERQKRIELERKLAALEAQQKQKQKRIDTDNQEPIINAFSKHKGANAIISGSITDNVKVAEVLINGQAQKLSSTGTFETNFYIPRTGKTIEIVAFDIKGNRANKTLRIKRDNIQQASGPTFDTLNPSSKRVKPNPNALALIIGVADYAKTPANALYADKDAQQFYDYATMKLGIPSSNIKELVNAKADLGEILINVKEWLRRSAKPNESDIYIYFAGHGLASQDGTKMYLLPYDGRPRLLENTALLRDELFKDIKQANPRSITVFLDTCYSGVTRNEEMLIAGRPIVVKVKEQAVPEGFTLFSAASNDQISRPLEEAKHGMFSYFLMKGMEGDADANNDNKITARELHAYVEQNVVQQSSGSQTPELQGDKDRVLVQFD